MLHCALPQRWLPHRKDLDLDIVNLTPHTTRLLAEDGSVLREWPSPRQQAPRVRYEEEQTSVGGIPVSRKRVSHVRALPDPRDGVGYLVSRQVAHAVRGQRDDIYFMDGLVRKGNVVIGARTLAQFTVDGSAEPRDSAGTEKPAIDCPEASEQLP